MTDSTIRRGRPNQPDPADSAATASSAMISTSHPLATAAGLAALRSGGTAVDAYVAAAAVQTVVEPTMTSLAGGLAVHVYDPATGESQIVGGAAGLPAAEDGRLSEEDRWTGRTVVAPGWVHGAHVAWSRWGKLGWADVLAHAVQWARDGFVIDEQMWGFMFENRTTLGRYAEGREVWCPTGRLASVGDVLRQPALARTLQHVAEQGPDYIYTGAFAQKYVETARAAGGRITVEDMAAVRETSREPVSLPALPLADGRVAHTSGAMYALALNLAAVGGMRERARPTEDPMTLYLQLRIVQECWHHMLAYTNQNVWGLDGLGPLGEAASVEAAEKLWPQVEGGPPRPFDAMNLNTNAIVAVDGSGMIAYGTHSHSGKPFGVGLMVDGVTIPRPLYHFGHPLVPIPAGWGTTLLVLDDGKPRFAVGSPSISAVECVLQNTMNVLDWGMSPGESVEQPRFGASHYPSQRPMVETSFGDDVIANVERRGLAVTPVTPWEPETGSCHAVRIDADGTLHGAADPRRLGQVAGC